MRKLAIFILIVLAISIISGCATETRVAKTPINSEKAIESSLKQGMQENSLLAIKEESVNISQGQSKTGYLLIKNAYDKRSLFNIKQICEKCLLSFNEQQLTMEADSYKLVKFTISSDAEPGTYEQGIKITDNLDNAYAFGKVMITID